MGGSKIEFFFLESVRILLQKFFFQENMRRLQSRAIAYVNVDPGVTG